MEFIAHRGASFGAPENSLQAMNDAIDEGADRIELDVRSTSDGVVVVSHDPTTGRCGDRDLVVAETEADALREVRLGNGEPVPRLDDVCDLLRGRVTLDVEIKSPGPTVVCSTLATLGDHGMLEDAIITSFSGDSLRAARRVGFEGTLGLIVGSKSWSPTQRLREAWPLGVMQRAGADALVIHHKLAHAALRARLSRTGRALYVWMSIEDELVDIDDRRDAYRRLARLEPRGVIVGRVAEARSALGAGPGVATARSHP